MAESLHYCFTKPEQVPVSLFCFLKVIVFVTVIVSGDVIESLDGFEKSTGFCAVDFTLKQ